MEKITSVNGTPYSYWGDIVKRGTFATNMYTGETKQISYSGYVNNDLTVRKAIAAAFKLPTFRK